MSSMLSFRRNYICPALARRLPAGFALVSYLTVTIGLPLPSFHQKDHSQPFPCQDNPCGCQSAEQCWRHCCCLTPEERWTWARANHVQPPAYAEVPAGQEWQTTRLRDQAEEKGHDTSCSCCAPQATKKDPLAPAPKPCCDRDDTHTSCREPAPSQPTRAAESSPRWGLGLAALQCRGLSTVWVGTGAQLPAPMPMAWSPCLAPLGWLSYPDATACTLPSSPPDPPPRSACA